MLKRTPFRRKPLAPKVYARPPRAPLVPVRSARQARMHAKPRAHVSIEKEDPLRSEEYRRLVCTLACARCGIMGYTQAAHGDQGKGLALKSSDLTIWPGCGPHDGKPGCHYIIGTTGSLGRDERRVVEQDYALKAQRELMAQAVDDPSVARVLRKIGLIE